jgi:two-component system, OmpR family, sensor kinase
VIQSPPRPFLNAWQKRAILLFGASLLVVLAFAWFFARRLARPIRRFAVAADQLGRDASGPPVPEEGPAELRTSARALNAMQMRIGDYLRERTAMIGAIAHDLRTPLARIAFRIENAPDAVREPVQRDIEQMREMISATMDFVKGRARPAERRSLQLDALLTRLVTQAREMGQPVSLETRSPGRIIGDAVALERMFQNLIDNALAYGKRADLVLAQTAAGVIVTVRDEGPGLPEHLLETVFDPFTRAEPSRNRESGGVGLGLSIARSIAQDHGGGLSLANGREGGLVATVMLPAATLV